MTAVKQISEKSEIQCYEKQFLVYPNQTNAIALKHFKNHVELKTRDVIKQN